MRDKCVCAIVGNPRAEGKSRASLRPVSDVGGNSGEAPNTVAFHGGRHVDERFNLDGMSTNGSGSVSGGFERLFKENTAFTQEVVLETSGAAPTASEAASNAPTAAPQP